MHVHIEMSYLCQNIHITPVEGMAIKEFSDFDFDFDVSQTPTLSN